MIGDRMLQEGKTPERRQPAAEQGNTAAFRALQEQGRALQELIAASKGGTNRDLRRLASELEALIQKWDK